MTNPVCVFDFTAPADRASVEDLKQWLAKIAKQWVFQKEQGDETGYIHYQGRISLKVKTRLEKLIKDAPHEWGFHWSPTSKNNQGNDWYVTKEETRIEGPWSDKDKTVTIPKQVQEVINKGWYPWQISIYNLSKVWDTRTIHCIYNEKGNEGKSILCQYLRCMGIAMNIPFCNDFKDIMRMVMDMPKVGCYTIDMPRAINKEKLFQLFAAIEVVKGGYAYDDRYSFKSEDFDCPNIFVFTNKIPDFNLLSMDRWRLWEIKNHQLVPYDPNSLSNASLTQQLLNQNANASNPEVVGTISVPIRIPPTGGQ